MLWFAATTLLGAFLVFQVQPVISKCVLPWFGGTPAVWTTCMLFFQLLLFAGYFYAHVLKTYFRPAIQGSIHLVLLGSAALALPIEPSEVWKPTGSESPTTFLLWMLLCHVGLPYFVLSSTGPLIQAWLSYQDSSDRVYRLYALSNAGSLIALLSYPFVVEPFLSVSNQSVVWSLLFCGFVLVQGAVAIGLLRKPGRCTRDSDGGHCEESKSVEIIWSVRLLWLVLPALASTLLLVVTNHVCQDVAVIPFLWVLPLSLYLLSFIICFDSPAWYKPKWIAGLTMVAIVVIAVKGAFPESFPLLVEATCYMILLLGFCLLCHGEVARLKPPAKYLTQYYALLSAGGAIGGMVVAIVCPLVFNSFAELPLSLSIASGVAFFIFFACQRWNVAEYDWDAAWNAKYFGIALMVAPIAIAKFAEQDQTIASDRNFFGVLRVLETPQGIQLVHGSTVHGMQLPGDVACEPTTYYGRKSGVGRVLTAIQQDSSGKKIGVVGLGCGVLAAYGREQDEFDMLEINPAVLQIASEHFRFMEMCPSTIRHHLGDGRLLLEKLDKTKFDLLVLDAFSSDAIPAHLLTTEAFTLYRSRLAENGVLAVHVSNKHLDLAPLVHRLANESGLESRMIRAKGDDSIGTTSSTWMILAAPDIAFWQDEAIVSGQTATSEQLQHAPLWTDQHHNLVSVLRLW
ncbi:spermidine synthase [Novipirellula aureliae]|uniref:Spermidine synthase n=2 Tax=Novipirellula aureliae TaxID=2527966 RepID=A0A5C6EDC7_9BACT|nr:spermidine synthase [Novipirellula aureliae]